METQKIRLWYLLELTFLYTFLGYWACIVLLTTIKYTLKCLSIHWAGWEVWSLKVEILPVKNEYPLNWTSDP